MNYKEMLANLDSKITGVVTVRRYNLAAMVSESYKSLYECDPDTNLQKLVEAHLTDVRTNPTDTDRLSHQLCKIKHLISMKESIDDSTLFDVPKKRVVKKAEVIEKKDESLTHLKESLEEADDPELTDEEIDELAKHLETIRKERKAAPKTEMTEEIAPRKGIRCTTHKTEMQEEADPEEQEEVEENCGSKKEDLKEFAGDDNGISKGDIQGVIDFLTDYLDEMEARGIEYAPAQANTYGIYGQYISFAGKGFLELIPLDDQEDEYYDESKEVVDESKKTGAIGAKIGDVIVDTKTGKEGTVKKLGSSGNYGLIYVDFGNGTLRKINPMDDAQTTGRYNLKESQEVVDESASYKGLENFSKNSSAKAFYKTFKKMHESLKEGKALTRQESMNLYKAANSAMTQLSVELEHNPEFLETFKECTSLLSVDVAQLLESMKNDKAPSKKTMKSLSKFSEALLFEADDEDEETPEEQPTEDEEFVGDDEGDVQSEEEEAFDQEYADARVELHKELAGNHADDEDPGVQEKIQQDADEVTALPGITDEQIAEITGEGESAEEEEPAEDEEDDSVETDDGDEITDDELSELKKHLKEMREAKKLKESADESDLFSSVEAAIKKAGINYSIKGNRRKSIIVAKKDLQKASEIRNKIDTKYSVEVKSLA